MSSISSSSSLAEKWFHWSWWRRAATRRTCSCTLTWACRRWSEVCADLFPHFSIILPRFFGIRVLFCIWHWVWATCEGRSCCCAWNYLQSVTGTQLHTGRRDEEWIGQRKSKHDKWSLVVEWWWFWKCKYFIAHMHNSCAWLCCSCWWQASWSAVSWVPIMWPHGWWWWQEGRICRTTMSLWMENTFFVLPLSCIDRHSHQDNEYIW